MKKILIFFVLLLITIGLAGVASPIVPTIWDDAALKDWATPLANGLVPGHYASAEYYRVPADNLRTYPVFHPDHEPPGYWAWLNQQKPEPIVDASRLVTKEDWIAAGQRAFLELDVIGSRTNDPEILAMLRDPRYFEAALADGSVWNPRWVVTEEGPMLTHLACANCHMQQMGDQIMIAGPGPGNVTPSIRANTVPWILTEIDMRMVFGGGYLGENLWRMTVTPWRQDERVEQLRQVRLVSEIGGIYRAPPRNNGSPFYGAKTPDLHLLRYYRYLDATATHQLRGPEDVARYAALISGADSMEFGHHRILEPEQRRVPYRYADEVLYAIGTYLLSLEPPKNPNPPFWIEVGRGQAVFYRQGCPTCHVPPNYTSGRLTLAAGYMPPLDHPNLDDVLPVSLQTDPGLALNTRKGTGFYKIPSLRGLWYRPRLLHDGSVNGLEEMFSQERVSPGHPYGRHLSPREKAALIAFLTSL